MEDETESWTAEWQRMSGRVPEVARSLHEMNPIAEEGYRNLRAWIYEERSDGLTRVDKELVMIVMNIATGNTDGAVRHLKNGINHGMTVTQVREALSLTFLFLGVNTYLQSGQAVWAACASHVDAAANDARQP
jgi:alkylhydroperoxidase/carboxymuconolactone decarboxylase family protein YurZ